MLIRRAKSLLILGVFVSWFSAIAIYIKEKIMYGKSTEYSSNILFFIGLLFLIITLVSAITAIFVSWSKNEQNHYCVSIFHSLFGVSFVFAILIWSSAWAIS